MKVGSLTIENLVYYMVGVGALQARVYVEYTVARVHTGAPSQLVLSNTTRNGPPWQSARPGHSSSRLSFRTIMEVVATILGT